MIYYDPDMIGVVSKNYSKKMCLWFIMKNNIQKENRLYILLKCMNMTRDDYSKDYRFERLGYFLERIKE